MGSDIHTLFNYRLRSNASDDKSPQDSILFCVGESFKNMLDGGSEGILEMKCVDQMLIIISKSFQSGQESRDLKQELCHMLLHDSTTDFMTEVGRLSFFVHL